LVSAIDFVLTLILRLVAAVLTVIGVAEEAVRRLLIGIGVTGQLQAAVMVIAAIFLIVIALRLLGNVFGVLLTLLLVLLILHVLMPGLQLPHEVHI
jgi:hypothetical protein